jgi:hypothetical protein
MSGDVFRGRVRTALVSVAFVYLVTLWLDAVGSNIPTRYMPRVWVYFAQIAALFKRAGAASIDYRAEGYVCASGKWTEIDVRPWFALEAGTKENRFHRVLQFYRAERKVMRELDEYVVTQQNAGSGSKIGGVRFSSLRLPYPKLGDEVRPYERKPLSEHPESVKKAWYWTPASKRRERCGVDVREDDKPPPEDVRESEP